MERSVPDKVRATIEKYRLLAPGDRVVVGVSGGPDSLALLHALLAFAPEYRLVLWVAHLNHMFRGQAAAEDAEYVRALAERLGLGVTVEAVDVPKLIAATGLSPEEAARQARYDFLHRVADKVGANRIAVGQNRDDQAETILLNLLRGAGAEGLAGMDPGRDSIVIRPLLAVPRSEIEAYCASLGLTPRIDATNSEPIYRRNRIRLQLLPLLEREYNANIREGLVRTAALLRDEQDYLSRLTRARLSEISQVLPPGIALDLDALAGEHRAMQRRLLRAAIEAVHGDLRGIEFDHIEAVLRLVSASPTGKRLDLPRGLVIEREYGRLRLYLSEQRSEVPEPVCQEITVPGMTVIRELGCQVQAWFLSQPGASDTPGRYLAWLDLDRLTLPLKVRTRRDGDWLQPLGMAGTKKVKAILQEAKVPRSGRERVPLLVDGEDQIIWVVGYKLAAGAAASPGTRRVLAVAVTWPAAAQN